MRAVVQRVSEASVTVEGECVARIGRGLLVLWGIEAGDSEVDVARLVERIAQFRLFPDADGRMNFDLSQAGGELLLVSQFTLVADVRRGRRPSFDRAEKPARAQELVEHALAGFRARGLPTQGGRFGAHMQVRLLNDGPVTFVFEERSAGARSGSASTS